MVADRTSRFFISSEPMNPGEKTIDLDRSGMAAPHLKNMDESYVNLYKIKAMYRHFKG
jgi:hypothetical protein